ncbi:MAG: trimethylamine methyltransferase family protein [Candidatus Bathyarchaeia archaeon]
MFKFLSNEEIWEIHNASLKMLNKLGVIVKHEKFLKMLKEAGADVNEEKQLAKLPVYLIEELINKAPSGYIMGGRKREHDLYIGDGKGYVRSQGGCDHILDLETGIIREANTNDVVDAAVLQDALENIHWCASFLHPSDEPPMTRDLYQLMLMMENTVKHIVAQPYTTESFKYQVEMAKTIAGSEEEFMKRPLISVFVGPTSPLEIDKHNCELIEIAAKNRIPIMPVSAPIAGATGPVTLAGLAALAHAEIMMITVLAQLINPGTPIEYTPRPNTMDMRTAQALWGAIEYALASAIGVQLARFIKLPVCVQCLSTDSKLPDGQACIEKSMQITLAALMKPDTMTGAGGIDSVKTASLEQLVIDNEIIGIAKRIAKGIEVNEETIAYHVVERVKHGGHFLADKHTAQYYLKEHYIPKLFDRNTRGAWEAAGKKDLTTRARETAKKILKEYERRPLDEDIKKELRKIMNEARKNLLK